MEMLGNREMGALKFRLNYSNLVATCASFPDILGKSKGLFEEVEKRTKEESENEDQLLIHGDFWSGK